MAPHVEEHSVRSAAGDSDIGYLKFGSGPALVIVPGALGLAFDWSFVANALANQVTCYPIDLFCRDELKMKDEQIAFMRSTPTWGVLVSLAPTLPEEWESIWRFDRQVKNYAGLCMPALFLTGSMTQNNPSYATDELVGLLPDAHKVLLEGQGHMGHLAAPDLVAKEIATFLLTQRDGQP